MSIPKGYIEEILGMSFRARHKEDEEGKNQFMNPIIHRQIHGDKVYIPFRLWNE